MEWIQTSERLPDINEEVLATTSDGIITIAWRTSENKWLIYEGEDNATTDDILAWMYLPKPYNVT